ncbi:hypothetical protein K461DRAFT_271292 [Myriangium duriaei CBS 260.36]|uniref:Uncharacterized protein n=1 Tax=Myriangium duriaei CBS 260.36 TaxID=1168546 RepID=A0A9P4IRD6_9PEZI|nr:hypothetical protein K461DRAFT_271292 [Myriangium duriaei CBS 260.36]
MVQTRRLASSPAAASTGDNGSNPQSPLPVHPVTVTDTPKPAKVSREMRKLLIDAEPSLGGSGSLKRKRRGRASLNPDTFDSPTTARHIVPKKEPADDSTSFLHTLPQSTQPQGSTPGTDVSTPAAQEPAHDTPLRPSSEQGNVPAQNSTPPQEFLSAQESSPVQDTQVNAAQDAATVAENTSAHEVSQTQELAPAQPAAKEGRLPKPFYWFMPDDVSASSFGVPHSDAGNSSKQHSHRGTPTVDESTPILAESPPRTQSTALDSSAQSVHAPWPSEGSHTPTGPVRKKPRTSKVSRELRKLNIAANPALLGTPTNAILTEAQDVGKPIEVMPREAAGPPVQHPEIAVAAEIPNAPVASADLVATEPQPPPVEDKAVKRALKKLAINGNESLGGTGTVVMRSSLSSRPVRGEIRTNGRLAKNHNTKLILKQRQTQSFKPSRVRARDPVNAFPEKPNPEMADYILRVLAEAAQEHSIVRALEGDARQAIREGRHENPYKREDRMHRELADMESWQLVPEPDATRYRDMMLAKSPPLTPPDSTGNGVSHEDSVQDRDAPVSHSMFSNPRANVDPAEHNRTSSSRRSSQTSQPGFWTPPTNGIPAEDTGDVAMENAAWEATPCSQHGEDEVMHESMEEGLELAPAITNGPSAGGLVEDRLDAHATLTRILEPENEGNVPSDRWKGKRKQEENAMTPGRASQVVDATY